MDTLPGYIQHELYRDKHECELHTILEQIRLVTRCNTYSGDINECHYSIGLLSDGNETERSPPSVYSLRAATEHDPDVATPCLTYTPLEDWDLGMEAIFNGFNAMHEDLVYAQMLVFQHIVFREQNNYNRWHTADTYTLIWAVTPNIYLMHMSLMCLLVFGNSS